jgi:hypothetical protein
MSRTATVQPTAINDPRLDRLLRASGSAADDEIERLIVSVAQPLVTSILLHHSRSSHALAPEDAQDIRAAISLRLISRLRALRTSGEEAIQDFDKYVATLTYNAMNDHLRKAFPARARLKNRLKYTLTHDPRLALWMVGETLVCGLREWQDRPPVHWDSSFDALGVSRAMLDRNRPAEALAAMLRELGGAAAFESVVAFAARIWHIADPVRASMDDAAAVAAGTRTAEIEERQYLERVWREIRELRPMQRKSLLLNLRSEESSNVVSLLLYTGVARFDEIAAALEMTREALAARWNELPLDDTRIAALLGVTRQQVINLRKAARQRLTRRTRNIG